MSASGGTRRWSDWHIGYDDPTSPQARRLVIIQKFINQWLDFTAPSQVKILSLCAGEGRDIIQVLGDRADRERASVTLIEQELNNVTHAQQLAARRKLANIQIRQADAGWTGSFQDAVPADLIIIAGVFGHVSEPDIQATIQALPGMCRSHAVVLWTRRRRPFGIVQKIATWFADEEFEEVPIPTREKTATYIGAHRFCGTPKTLNRNLKLFSFLPNE